MDTSSFDWLWNTHRFTFLLLSMIYFLPDSRYQPNTNPLNQSKFNGHLAKEKNKNSFLLFCMKFFLFIGFDFNAYSRYTLRVISRWNFWCQNFFFTLTSVDYDFIRFFLFLHTDSCIILFLVRFIHLNGERANGKKQKKKWNLHPNWTEYKEKTKEK